MKRFTMIIALLGIALMSFAKPAQEAKETLNSAKEAVSSIHQDVKDIVSVTHDDIKSITTTLYGDGKDAITSLYPDIKSAVIAIGQAIGIAAEHVYTVLVKKFVVDGVVQLLPFLFGLFLLGVGWYKTHHYFKKEYVEQEGKIKWNFLYPTVLVMIGIIILCNVNYNVMVMGLINPEFGAINYILDFTKNMIK